MTWVKGTSAAGQIAVSTNTLQVTGGQAQSVGDIVCVAVTWGTTAGAPATCVIDDPAGKCGTFVLSPSVADGTNQEINLVAFANITSAGIPTPRLRFNPTPGTSAAANASMTVDPFTGSNAASVLDGTGAATLTATGGAGTDNVLSGNWSNSTDGDLIYAGVTESSTGADSQTKGTGFTDGIATAFVVVRSEWKEQTTHSATTNATFSATGAHNYLCAAIAITPALGAVGSGPPDPRLLAYGRKVSTVQGRALFEALQTIEYIFAAGTQPAVSAADGSSTGSAAGTIAVGAATQTADAASTGAASATVAVGAATQKADATSTGDASATVANSSQAVSLATPLYPDPRYLTYGRLLGTPLMRAQAVLNWVIAPPTVAQTQISAADGSSSGVATAIAVGASSQTSDFSSTGSAAGTIAVGASTQKADFTAAGVAVPIAVGVGVTTADASSTAGATAIAISASKQAADALSQAGSTPIAVGAASQKADATSTAGSGASTIMVATTPFSTADGSSAGVATAVGTGASTASGAGLVIAGATPVAVSQATQAAAASSAGSAAGTTADATAPSPPIVVTVPTGITLEGGGAAQKWLHAKGDKKRRMARIERQDMLDIMELAQFAPQVQAYFAGKGGLPHAAR